MESELVSGFMTEHAAVIFVFFFLAEYASIVLMCILTSILFLGGYLFDYLFILNIIKYVDLYSYVHIKDFLKNHIISSPVVEGFLSGIILGFKSCIMIFVFI